MTTETRTIDTGLTENQLLTAVVEAYRREHERLPGEFTRREFMQAAKVGEKVAKKYLAEQVAAGKLTTRTIVVRKGVVVLYSGG